MFFSRLHSSTNCCADSSKAFFCFLLFRYAPRLKITNAENKKIPQGGGPCGTRKCVLCDLFIIVEHFDNIVKCFGYFG